MSLFSPFCVLFFPLASPFCYFKKADSNNSWRDRWRITRGSWSCIERRAQTEAVALIKNTAPISAKPWERSEGRGAGMAEKGKERRKGRNKEKKKLVRGRGGEKRNQRGEKFSAPSGRGLCWTLINGYCSPRSAQRLFTVSHKGGLYSCSGMHCDKII